MSSPLGRDGEIRTDVDHEVGRAELPVVGKLGRRRQVGPVSLGRIGFGPGDQGRDILVGERADVLELDSRHEDRPSTAASRDPRPPRRCRRHAFAPGRKSRARTGPPAPADGIPGSSSGGSGPRPCSRSGRAAASGTSGNGQPTASTSGVLTSLPFKTAAIASLSSLPDGLAFRLRRATNWSSIRP